MPKEDIYDILADLASDRPADASRKFRDLLDQRAEEAIKAHVRDMKLTIKDEEPESTPPESETNVDNTIDSGPSQEQVDAAKTAEQEAWEAAQNPSEIESTPDGPTDDHQVPIA